uniref:Aminotransferase class I/classII large domain-containing protein n=1 Tax=Chromera velia CCMP2878 TaxID=1169474 RepID=A0A0G4HDP9_9ALVE|eukprot:Cvel_26375.t1-p1 / transcript=Cvel_26375.t1 / gene=Cvel_26375 / organism=Chromera_velia_CCMP2878 / gene_product=Aspartate aminotransferase, putative / transcript_product=Aspartate aminotransferase, putative / location=Cvel_scaffold3126:1196-3276(+) / protein_length=420 / sequence_SO=supercontig / SO=protein_coding / is_pseudo=false
MVPPLSDHLSQLGTETAYAVAGEAKALAATGKTVYPFHIGDMNFVTPPCVVNACKNAIDEGKTGYCAAAGVQPLREAIAKHVTATRKPTTPYGAENVSVQPGGKPVIQKFLASVLQFKDNNEEEVMYPNPGYPIYESQARFLGATLKPYGFKEVDGDYRLDMDHFRSLIGPRTRAVILNNYHNPTGTVYSKEEVEEIASLCVKHNVWVLADEAYWDILYDIQPTSVASLEGMWERTVLLFTYSKSWGMTGWRLGAAVGPQPIIDAISKLTTNQEACTCHFVQYAGISCLEHPQAKEFIRDMNAELKKRRHTLTAALREVPEVKFTVPAATFYCWVDVTEVMQRFGFGDDVERFRQQVLKDSGVCFCTRAHFGEKLPGETKQYVRFAFSGISCEDIERGVGAFKQWIQNYNSSEAEALPNF